MAEGDVLSVMIAAARRAGAAALEARESGLRTTAKDDSSPVTQADRLAEAIICAALGEAFPGVPVVAEEAFAAGAVPDRLHPRFFLVDPIDGTREFVAGRDEFTVNIALLEEAYPVSGVVFAPARGTLYAGSPAGAFLACDGQAPRSIAVRPPGGSLRAFASRSHRTAETNAFLAGEGVEDVVAVGSSLKFCLLAEGEGDLYPCFGPTMEWDTAAGQAVLEAAGGRVVDAGTGERLSYGKRGRADAPDFRNPSFVASAAPALNSS